MCHLFESITLAKKQPYFQLVTYQKRQTQSLKHIHVLLPKTCTFKQGLESEAKEIKRAW